VKDSARSAGALRAALVPAFTPRRWRRFVERGGDPAALADPSAVRLGPLLGVGRPEAVALARALARADPGRELSQAAAAGIRILAWDDRDYPAALRELADPPPAVYLRGRLLECDRNAVAVVGARRATRYGQRIARMLAGDLARAGVTVVGGMARGIDAAAHAGALDADGRTVAVLGSGLLQPYPEDNVPLMERAARSGAILSEFPLQAPPARAHFPRRNRLVAALSLAVVVVEAGARSGAHSTVRHALDCGRTVMAVPGPVDSALSRGTLTLLQEGAAPVGSATDVFAALGWCTVARSDLPDAERQVLDALGEEGATASEAARVLGMREEVVAGYLVTLEVRGLVTRESGSRYAPR
jgi:DNA processing protein